MTLSQRQKTAQAIAAELHKLGVAVTNPMPLDSGARLRFHVLDRERAAVLERVSSWGWGPHLVSSLPRVCPGGLRHASIYEIDIPAERQPVPDARKIPVDVAERKKTADEVEAVRKYLGLR